MSTAVTVERYAEMRAEIESGALRDEVLARFQVSAETWAEVQRAWLSQMGQELARGRFELSNRYSQAFLEKQQSLVRAAPREAAPETRADRRDAAPDSPADVAFAPVVTPAAVVTPAVPLTPPSVAAAPASAMPSFLRAAAKSAEAARAQEIARIPEITHAPPVAPAPPVAHAMIGETVAAADLAAIVQKALPFGGESGSTSGTPSASSTARAANMKALPFGGASGPATNAASSASAADAPRAVKREPYGGTVAAFSLPVAAAVPFEKKASDEASIENAKRHAAVVQGPEKAPSTLSGETVAPQDLASIMKRVMPFPGGDAAAARPAATAASAAPKRADVPARATTPGAAATPGATLNPGAAPGVGVAAAPRAFTVEQYASLCEDIAIAGGRAGEVLPRYGLTDDERRGLDAHWAALFQKQPTTFLAWQNARTTYRAWLKKQRDD